MNQVADEKLLVEAKGEKYEILIQDKIRMKAWETYCDFSTGKKMNIKTKEGKIIEMEILIDDYLVYQVQEFVRYIIVKSAKNKVYDVPTYNMEKRLKEEKSLKKIFDYFRKDKINEEQIMDTREKEEAVISIIEEYEGRTNRTPRFKTGLLKHYQTNKTVKGSKNTVSDREKLESLEMVKDALKPKLFGNINGNNSDLLKRNSTSTRNVGNLNKGDEDDQLLIKKSKSSIVNKKIKEENEEDNDNVLDGPILEVRKEKTSTNENENSGDKMAKDPPININLGLTGKVEAVSMDNEEESEMPSGRKRKKTLIENLGIKTLKNILKLKKNFSGKSSKSSREIAYETKKSLREINTQKNKKGNKGNILNINRGDDKLGKLNIRRIKTKSEKSSSGGSINAKRIRGSMIEKIIKKHYRPEKTTAIYWTSFVIMIFFFLIHFLSVIFKDPVQKMTNADIKEQAVNVDVFSWEIWANVYTVFFGDVCVATREGWIDNNSPVEDFNLTMFEKCHSIIQSTGGFYFPPDDLIDKKIRNISFLYLYKYENFVKTEFEIPMYEIDHKTKKLLHWKNVTFSRRGGMKFIHERAKLLTSRDYENDTTLINLTTIKNRELDYEWDQVRRISIGDLNYQYALRSYDFYEYLKGVAYQNELFIQWSIAIPCLITIFIFLVYTLYVVNEVKSMRFFYRTLFNCEVKF